MACPQGRQQEALSAFAEDVYYCSLEYGPEDPRTSLGYYNTGKVGWDGVRETRARAGCGKGGLGWGAG